MDKEELKGKIFEIVMEVGQGAGQLASTEKIMDLITKYIETRPE